MKKYVLKFHFEKPQQHTQLWDIARCGRNAKFVVDPLGSDSKFLANVEQGRRGERANVFSTNEMQYALLPAKTGGKKSRLSVVARARARVSKSI